VYSKKLQILSKKQNIAPNSNINLYWNIFDNYREFVIFFLIVRVGHVLKIFKRMCWK